jgi:hypothetical protein
LTETFLRIPNDDKPWCDGEILVIGSFVRSFLFPALLSVVIVGGAGCDRDEISVREIPKGAEKIAAEPQDRLERAPDETGTVVIWRVPEGWREVPSGAPMRLATFEITDSEAGVVEVAVTSFPGEVGGVLANVNRWRGQMGVAPVDEAGLEQVVRRFSRPGYEGYFTTVEGSGTVMLAGGVYGALENQSWFVRAEVPSPASAEAEESILGFLKTFGQAGDE